MARTRQNPRPRCFLVVLGLGFRSRVWGLGFRLRAWGLGFRGLWGFVGVILGLYGIMEK